MKKDSASLRNLLDYGKIVIIFYLCSCPDVGVNHEKSHIGMLG